MKSYESDFEKQLKKLNDIQLTEKESSEAYQKIISGINRKQRKKNVHWLFSRTFATLATVFVLIAAGWFLNDIITSQPNNQGDDQLPVIDEQDENNVQDNEESNVEPQVDEGDSCAEISEEPKPNSIYVYFNCIGATEQLKPVLRDMNKEATLEEKIYFALEQLTMGPSESETESGYYSIFTEETSNIIQMIELQDSGHLVVNFQDVVPGGNRSIFLMESLNYTLAQFEEVQTIEFQLNGSCDEYGVWLGADECVISDANNYRMNNSEEPHVKDVLLNKTEGVFNSLMMKDWDVLSNYLHEEHGLVYSPFSNVGDEDDLHFTKDEVANFGNDQTLYSWSWDQSGAEFMATPNDFVEHLLKNNNEYVYDYKEISYNETNMGTMINTIHEVYPNAIFVEYLDEPDRDSLDWYKYQALRFLYEEIDDEWYLIAIVRGAYNP